MGTPTTVTYFAQPLSITTQKKFQILKLAQRMGPLDVIVHLLHVVLTELRVEIFEPLVRNFDKPIAELWKLPTGEIPKHLRKHRVMIVNDRGLGLLYSLALDRHGRWFALYREQPLCAGLKLKRMDSVELQFWLAERVDQFACEALGCGGEKLPEEIEPLAELIRYAMVVRFAEECIATVSEALYEKEKRIATMRERVAMGREFTQALDPFQRENQTTLAVHVAEYHHENGMSVATSRYFSENALHAAFKRPLATREALQGSKADMYLRNKSQMGFCSLDRLVFFAKDLLDEIDRGGKSESFHLGCRPPLTQEELTALKQWAATIK